MKALVIAFIIFNVGCAKWAPKFGKDVAKIRNECAVVEGVTGETLESLKKYQYPDTPSMRCYMRCIANNLGLWDDHLGLNANRVTEQIKLKRTTDAVKPGVEKCIYENQQRPDDCTWIYRQIKCMVGKGLFDIDGIIKS